jgi:Ca-activated chloride channel family protein
MIADLGFAWPAVFLLLPLPWLARRWLRPLAPARLLRLPALDVQILPAAPGHGRIIWLAWLAWALLLAAAARPQLPDTATPLPVSGRSLMLALDLSASMATRDIAWRDTTIDRLAAARTLGREFLARRGGDRVGLIVFGRQAYLHVPPTFDLQAVGDALDGTAVGLAGNETALGDAIALATSHLRRQPDQSRVLVLLTDGAHTAGELAPQRAAWLAQREGVRIHAVGIGAVGIGAAATGGPATSERNRAFDLDETTLRAIAAQTGGRYQRATDGAGLADFFRQLDQLEALPDQDPARRPAHELYPLPLLAAMLLAAWLGWRRKCRRGLADPWPQVVDAALMPHVLIERRAPLPSRLPWAAAWLLAALALALPWLLPSAERAASYRGATLRVIVADLSSAAAEQAVRTSLLALLDALPPGETALILAGGEAFLAVPPTSDTNNIAALAPELAAAIMPVPGDEPQRALALARELLSRNAARDGAILWLTANPAALAALPRRDGEQLFAIGVAAADAAAQTAAAVAALAARGGWQAELARPSLPQGTLPALPLLALLPLAAMAFRRGLLLAVMLAPTLAAVMLFAPESRAQAGAQADDPRWQAVAHYRAGRHADALRLLAGQDDPVSHYNRGNALARMGRYADAEAAYTASLAQRPGNADALFNRELMQRLRNPPPPPAAAPPTPPTPPPPATAPPDPAPTESSRAAEQWLRGVPDNPAGLLRAKLRLEHERRQSSAATRVVP